MSYRKHLMTSDEPPSELYKAVELGMNLAEVGTGCISRQAAIRWVKTECNPYGKPTLEFESGKKVIEHLLQMPPAQPERIKGHWVNGHCDKCNEHAPFWCMASTYHESNFCPNCGADMREVTT